MTSITSRLARIYGAERAATIAGDIEARLARFSAEHPELGAGRLRADALALAAGDNLLITYGDQFHEPGVAPLSTLARFIDDRLGELISGVHVLPCFPYSSDDGFSVVDYREIDPAIGDWADIAALARSRAVMLDAVINHISAESAWFAAYRAGDDPFSEYFIDDADGWDLSQVVRPRTSELLTEVPVTRDGSASTRRVWTTFSADQIDLDYRNPEVLLAVLDVLLRYVAGGARLLRLDAVGFLYKRSASSCIHLDETHQLIKLLRQCFDRVAPDVLLITETNVPHADNIAYFGDGHDEAQLVYNFSLPPLLLDAFEVGDASVLTRWAATLELPSARTTWFNFLASHDGVGVRPAEGLLEPQRIDRLVERVEARGGQVGYRATADAGKRPYELQSTLFDAMTPPGEGLERSVARFRAAHAIMLALQGLPGIYAHSLLGSANWQQGFGQTGHGRTLNRRKLSLDEVRELLADADGRAARVLAAFKQLLHARRAQPAFAPAAAQQVLDLGASAFALLRVPEHGAPVLAIADVSGRASKLTLELTDHPGAKLRSLLQDATPPGRALELEPYGVRWLALE